ncbi:bactofilin family protein [Lunatibacter salilacus]|uniref:bactofilin family protein n=1 Tax=Lunatibacter salilacus TaxID=2483804 RepID=UPI00131A88D4|nr:polymer-forming cytoskeletal protein [Lunatibacter salilacus]
MWNKEKRESTMEAKSTSFFAEGFKVHGNVVCSNDVRVEGVIYGNVTTTKKVIVGPTGQIFGNIKATNLSVMGEVTGEIVISELAKIDSTGSINGNLFSKNFHIEPGAIIEANLRGLKEGSTKIEVENDNHSHRIDKYEELRQVADL